MPKIKIEVTQAWWDRSQTGIANTVDTLAGVLHYIETQQLEGSAEPVDQLEHVYTQLKDLKRRVEAFRIPF